MPSEEQKTRPLWRACCDQVDLTPLQDLVHGIATVSGDRCWLSGAVGGGCGSLTSAEVVLHLCVELLRRLLLGSACATRLLRAFLLLLAVCGRLWTFLLLVLLLGLPGRVLRSTVRRSEPFGDVIGDGDDLRNAVCERLWWNDLLAAHENLDLSCGQSSVP